MKKLDESIKQELAADGSLSGVEQDVYTPYPFDVEKISITRKTLVLSNVVKRIERKLIHAADIQRRENLWDIEKQSRLIESLMLKIPLPLFYVAADKDDELTIVDGLQRISAIKGYISENSFGLEGLEFLTEFNGKSFKELPESMQIRIEETNLDFVVINPDSSPAVQRNIFKRLNTGGLPLTEQEIRHALYYGPVTQLLNDLVETEEFKIATDRSVNDSRMAAQELILRYLAFSIMGIAEYRKNEEMDSFLSDAMQIINMLHNCEQQNKNSVNPFNNRKIINGNIKEFEMRFSVAMTRAYELFGNCAFRISTPLRERRTPINKSLFELWAILLSKMPDETFAILADRRELLYQKLEDSFNDSESHLREFVGKDSTKAASVKSRYEIIGKLINAVIQEEQNDNKS
ncbi:DUF262 domain-containing protein [Breznakiellaceae bacterium SP9]